MPQRPTYFIAPNFNIEPDTREIALGNILADLEEPERSLSKVDDAALSLRYPRVKSVTAESRTLIKGASRTISGALWSEFALSTVGGKLAGERSSGFLDEIRMEAIETQYFIDDPPLDELELRLQAPRVKNVVRPGKLSFRHQPVYMVTGIVIAHGISIRMQKGALLGAEVAAQASAPTPAGDVGVGASLGAKGENVTADEWTIKGDRVIAYRLLEIKVNLTGKKIDLKTYREGADMLTERNDRDSEEEDGSWAKGKLVIDQLDAGHITGEESIEAKTVDVEDGEVAICILVPT